MCRTSIPNSVGKSSSETAGVVPLYDQAVRLFSKTNPIAAAFQGAAVGAWLGQALPIAAFVGRFSVLDEGQGLHRGGKAVNERRPAVVSGA
ncbi:MAG TPA: hypothetical protein VFE03_16305 [Caulobacteraceae bacterium]|nr:hypothetical protein [Caulobacteraceae bacterium]